MGDVLTANCTTETANENVQSIVTNLEVALANKMLVSDIGNSTLETEQLVSTPSAVQVVNSEVATPPNFRIRDVSIEIPRGDFKVFENKIFLD